MPHVCITPVARDQVKCPPIHYHGNSLSVICTTYRVSLALPLPVVTTCAPPGGSFTAAFHKHFFPWRALGTNVLIWPSHYIQITAKQPLICNVYDYDWPPRPTLPRPVAAAASAPPPPPFPPPFPLTVRFLSFMAPNVYTSLRVRQKMQFIKRRTENCRI